MAGKRVVTTHDNLTFRIIGCALAVHNARGPGYREDTYQRDLEGRCAESELSDPGPR